MSNKIDKSPIGTIFFYASLIAFIALGVMGYQQEEEYDRLYITPQNAPPPEWTTESVLIFGLMAIVALWGANLLSETGGTYRK